MATAIDSTCSYVAAKLLIEAVEDVLKDEAFMLGSAPATKAREMCCKLSEWMTLPQNGSPMKSFADKILSKLRSCIPSKGTPKNRREKMWIAFHRMRLSESFKELWASFFHAAIEVKPVSLLFQHLTEKLFEAVIKEEYEVATKSVACASVDVRLTSEEANALRYVAGYVCSKVQKKIAASQHPHKDQMLLCLITLCDEDQEEQQTAVDWINAVDRGGLCHVSETTFQLFLEMESIVKAIYKIDAVDDVEKGGKNEWVQKVLYDDDVQFQWCLLSAEVGEAEATSLLTMLVDLYV